MTRLTLMYASAFSLILACMATLALSPSASAQGSTQGSAPAAQAPSGEPRGGHRGPPPEALEACKTLKAGAACSFSGPHGSHTGQCWAPQDKPLACRPAHAPGEGRPGAGPQTPQR